MAADLIQIQKPGPPSIVAEMAPIVAAARAFAVTDIEGNAEALVRVRNLRAAEKKIADLFEPARKKADDAKKEILKLRDQLIGPIEEARFLYDGKAATFEAEQRRIALEQEARLREAARKQEEERALQAAIEAEAAGETAEAEAILDAPVEAPAIAVAPQVAKVEGVSSRTVWSAEVTDLHALVKYVAAHPEWLSLLEPAMPNLNRMATAQRAELSFPGVKAVSRVIRATR